MSATEEPVVTGSCLCRAITYTATGAPLMTTLCHCYNCRKASGAPVQGASVYLSDKVTFSGAEPKTHTDFSTDSGAGFHRKFCGECGTQLGGQSAMALAYLAINAGTLDQEFVNAWKPGMEQYCATQAGFWPTLAQGPRFERGMTGAQMQG